MKNEETGMQRVLAVTAPFTGQAVPLEDVPDPVFSQKIVGDGLAIIPEDGKLLSPVDGEVVSVAETLHAYGLRSEEGVELMIHVGLETVALKGECFQCCVKTGDKIKRGQMLAQVDLEKAAASLAVGSSTQLQYQSAENAFITAKNTVETTKLQLLLAMENYDWIVKGLVASK